MASNNTNYHFFMAANTKDGFVSLFPRAIEEDEYRQLYSIKSGPGCGKSTLMRKIAAYMGCDGPTEYIHCSSDPDSLDGIILRNQGFAVIDGTAPHVTDLAFPGAEGRYITFPPFADQNALLAKRAGLRHLSARAKACYAQAYRLISASYTLDEGVRAALRPLLPADRLNSRANGIIRREIPKKYGNGKLMLRFLDGITPTGWVCLSQTVSACADKIYAIEDSFGLAGFMLEAFRDAALSRGYDVYACLDPKDGHSLRHVLIPGLSLAFVTTVQDSAESFEAFRRIRVDAYLDKAGLKPIKGKIKLQRRVSASIMDDAAAEIARAHALHSEIETLYLPHVDFAALDQMAENLVDEFMENLPDISAYGCAASSEL